VRRAPHAPLLLLLVAFTLPCLAAGDASLLPPDGFGRGWRRIGPPKVFEGAALYDHIDGGGEPFLEIGFEACTVQRYASGKDEAVLEIYRMTDETAALGVFLTAGGSITLDSPEATQSTGAENQATLRKGRYFFVATCPEARSGMAAELSALAAFPADKVEAGTVPPVLSLLPRTPPVAGTLRIFRGPAGLQAVATLGEGDVLLQGGKVAGAAGDFGEGNPPRTVIALAYPTAAEASAALVHLRSRLDATLRPVKWEEGLLVFQDAKGRFGRAASDGPRLTVTLGLTEP
jgi:hypothetical protein